jgi:hypothetical protein
MIHSREAINSTTTTTTTTNNNTIQHTIIYWWKENFASNSLDVEVTGSQKVFKFLQLHQGKGNIALQTMLQPARYKGSQTEGSAMNWAGTHQVVLPNFILITKLFVWSVAINLGLPTNEPFCIICTWMEEVRENDKSCLTLAAPSSCHLFGSWDGSPGMLTKLWSRWPRNHCLIPSKW